MIDFTVAIRTYNSSQMIPEILERLRSQLNIDNFSWEIIVIDNNSTDNTLQIIQNYQSHWSEAYPLSCYIETKQGASFARQRAIKEARGTLIGFLDDDNFPDKNWVASAYTFGKSHPQAGAYGSQVYGKFEIEPPENFNRLKPFLAIIERGSEPKLYDPDNIVLPPGAGLVIRKQAWVENVPEKMVLQGPVGKSLAAKGEDSEALLYIAKGGWEIWYNPEMCIEHQIPAWRLEKNYLLSVARGCGLATCHLRVINAKKSQIPLIVIRTIIGNCKRIVQHLIKYRGKISKDIVVACEIEFYKSNILSAFSYLKTKVKTIAEYVQ